MEQTQDSQQVHEHHDGRRIGAVVLIVVGAIFLLRNFEFLNLGRHWWALFFLIPISALVTTLQRQRKAHGGALPPESRGSIIGVVTLTTLMCIFLFGVNWGTIWPIFIIIGGLSLILKPSAAR